MGKRPKHESSYTELDGKYVGIVSNALTRDNFLNRTQTTQILKPTNNNKWYLMKLKSFCKAKEMVNLIKRQITEWENCFFLTILHPIQV